MADVAVSLLVEKLSEILDSNGDFIFDAENELRQLERDLVLFRSILEEAATREEDEGLGQMEWRIREFVYDVEDTIAACMSTSAMGDKSLPRLPNLNLAQALRSLTEDNLKPMLDFAANLQIGHGSAETSQKKDSWKLVKKAPGDIAVAFDEMVYDLVGYLIRAEPGINLDVVSIVGKIGLGKTTMAWEIFGNKKIEYEYPTRIWINLFFIFNQRDLFLRIVKAFTSRDVTSMGVQGLGEMVRGYLREEKFLLVLDDVITVEAWNYIQYVLPWSNNMSKVLITTFNSKVAKHANRNRTSHMLRLLTKEESWKLLQLHVFGELDNQCSKELEFIGREIAGLCDGMKLAILLIGGILAYGCSMPENNEIISAWNDLSKTLRSNRDRYISYDCISDIVSLAYNRLPKDLRDCFLYLGVFPKNYEISTWTLTRLWIAEGFIQHNNNKELNLEKAAQDHLKNLINRNLLTICKRNSLGQVKTCRLNRFVREFCVSKSWFDEDSLFQEMAFKDGCFDPPVSEMQGTRRIVFHSHLSDFLSDTATKDIYCPRTHSLLCFNEGSIPPEYVSTIPTAFNLLRVLESKSIRFSRFPMKLSKLIHLKYITLSYENLKVLPEPVSALRNLQTLVLDTSSPTLEMRANIWGMTQLRHLKTKASIVLAIQGGGEGNAGHNLQTLSRLSPENCTIQVFNQLPNLKRLGIRGNLATFLNNTSGCRLERLNCLVDVTLMNDLLTTKPQSGDRLVRLPPLDFFPPFLMRLTLSATYLDWTEMSVLGKINTLEVLRLKNNAFTGMCWQAHGHSFSRLRFLLIAKADFVHWEGSSSGCFCSLTQLVLKNCQNLLEIPICLARSLTVLDIEHINKSAVESAWEIKEEGSKLKLNIGLGCD